MRVYLLSLGAGLLVGVVYSLLNVRSPAPPVIALVGLLGILAGEQIVPIAKRLLSPHPISASWLKWLSFPCPPFSAWKRATASFAATSIRSRN